MASIDTLTIITVIWAVVIVAFIILMVYRANLSNHETDQLFLNEATPSSVHMENDDVVRRLNRLAPICKGVGAVAILMSLVVGVMWFIHSLPASSF